jgi:hypothetical protein
MKEPLSVPQAVSNQERAGSDALAALSDAQLLLEVSRLASREREAVANLVQALGEIDARKLYLKDGCSSLFTYCTERLHLSEHAAYRRIEAARLARRLPLVLERLREGGLTLTAVSLLGPHLTDANCREILDAARHQSKRAVEELLARLRPQPDVPTSLRRLPIPRAAAAPASADVVAGHENGRSPLLGQCGDDSQDARRAARAPSTSPRDALDQARLGGLSSVARNHVASGALHSGPEASRVVGATPPRAQIRPLSPATYSLHVTMSAETCRKLRHAQELLRHAVPTGDPAEVIDRALTLLVAHLEQRKCAELRPTRTRKRASPASGVDAQPAVSGSRGEIPARRGSGSARASRQGQPSRYIPAAVRRAVWQRDHGQCTFVGEGGRCTERAFLEFHHRVPFADGGAPTVENIALLCKVHNAYEADRIFAPPVLREPCEPYELGPGRVCLAPHRRVPIQIRQGKKVRRAGGRDPFRRGTVTPGRPV